MRPITPWRLTILGASTTATLFFATEPLNAQEVTKEARDLSAKKNAEYLAEKASTEAEAKRLKLPLLIKSSTGSAHLRSFISGQPIYRKSDNLNAAKTISTDAVWLGGSGGYLTTGGLNSTTALWDEGRVLSNHQEFVGGTGISRVFQQDDPPSLFGNDHATLVAGTIMAKGFDPDAKGMAYAAMIHAYDWDNDYAEMAATWVMISNHSYSDASGWGLEGSTYYWYGDPSMTEDWKFGFYYDHARNFDNIAYNLPYRTIVQSAGNDRDDGPGSQPVSHVEFISGVETTVTTVRPLDGASSGYDTLAGGAACAKNVITVGAVLDIPAGYSVPSDVQMTTFSGWGPTDDGRIKPDIVANGYQLKSPVASGTSAYGIASGTSMAAPSVAGSLVLVDSRLTGSFSPGYARAATLKAVTIHTASEAGPNPGPDYMFGWGLMNTLAAFQLCDADYASSGDFNVRELGIASTDTLEFPIVLASGTAARSTMVWTDPPGTVPTISVDPTTPILKNDLNLALVGPATYYPWSLDPANPSNAATASGPNTRDNVERIDVSSPTSGSYMARVTSSPSALTNGGQSFSLTLTGATRAANFWTAITHPTSTAALYTASCEYFDSAGNRYVASATTDSPSRVRLSKFDSGNSFVWSTIWYVSSATYHSVPVVIRTDSSGNVVLAAYANNDLYVVKFNSSGVWQWQNSYDRAGLMEYPRDMEINSSGDIFVTGATQQSSGYTGWITTKYLANGTRDWDKFLGPSSSKYDFPTALAVDGSGNCFVTGKFKATSSDCYFGDGEAVTVKYTSNGTKDWERQNTTDDFSFGGDVQTDSSGNIYVLTAARANASSLWDFQTIKYNTSGTAQWTSRMATSSYTYAYPRSLILGPSSDLYITGYWAAAANGQPSGSERIITAKYSTSTGANTWTSNLTYQLHLPTTSYFEEKVRDSIRRDSSGNMYVAGTFHNGTDLDAGYVKINSSGTFVTQRTYDSGSSQSNYQLSGPDIQVDGNVHILSKRAATSATAVSFYQ